GGRRPPQFSRTLLRPERQSKETDQWTRLPPLRFHRTLCALELSKNSWLLAIQFADHEQPSIYSMRGGDTEGLMAKLTAARDRWAKASSTVPAITLCYEVGYDAFWLARFLKARGIECLAIDH